MATSQRITFRGSTGADLSARLDLPSGPIIAYALFAHCFTCSKDILAAKRISDRMASLGFAVLRFDFTGLGSSEGEFANTNFSSNVEDLLCAVDYLREHYDAPAVMIGHSLGGAAVLVAATEVPELKAVVTIAAPAEAAHVEHNFLPHLDEIRAEGEAEVLLAGRKFTIRRQFLEDINAHMVVDKVKELRRPLLILHSPIDNTVGVENAAEIFTAARHPKSYISLENADHLLTDPDDAAYVAEVIAAWVARYVDTGFEELEESEPAHMVVTETLQGRFQARAVRGKHRMVVDEPESVGGLDSGPTPYDYLAAALGGCTTMTLRLYAEHKKLQIGRISVEVDHGKVDAAHCEDCGEVVRDRGGRIDRFERVITVEGGVTEQLGRKLVEIADKCPVHKTLTRGATVVTRMAEDAAQAPIITEV